MDKYNRIGVLSSLLWKLLERSGAQTIQIIVQLILARLLSPKEFGTMAIILVFINLSRVFIDGGFNVALIQKKDTDNLDYSSIYILSLIIAIGLYLVLFLSSPFIGNFYDQPQLSKLLRVCGILLFPGALNTVQDAFVAKNMLFKKAAMVSLSATLISGILGILAAYFKFGIWALIIQQILYSYVYTYFLQWTIKWKPQFLISWDRVQQLFSYGSRILGSGLVYRLYMESRTLIIGKMFNPSALGYYQRGEQIPKALVSNIDGAIQTVMLPTLSASQDNTEKVKMIVRRALKTSSFIVFPMMFGLAAVSESLIDIVLGQKWLDATIYLVIFSFTYAMWPIITINQQAIRALGRSDIILKTELIKRFIGIIIIFVTINISVEAIAWGFFLERLVETCVNAWPNKKLINYSYWDQVKDILPTLFQSIIMYSGLTFFNLMHTSPNLILLVQFVVGIIIYLVLSLVTKNESFLYLLRLMKSFK